ncbi:hypothetical protein IAT38_001989 [Cryptococcus sp. DSM 104549]
MSASPSSPPGAQDIKPAETYQIDSDEYDSDAERDEISEAEYDKLVEEAENGYSDGEMDAFTRELKESGLVNFLRDYLTPDEKGETRSLRKLLLGFGIVPPLDFRSPTTPNVILIRFAKVALSRILRRRDRIPDLASLDDALALLGKAKNIIVLSGAGISTSCGIPDFRSSTGLYAQLQEEKRYELDDPQQMFDIRYFRERPEVFYSFAKQIYPSNFVPSPCHRWIKMLEDRGVLLRNYTQNIDTLESLAGVNKVLQCHGSFKTASCLRCKTRVPGRTIEPFIMAQQIPYCGPCREKCAAEREARRAYRAKMKKAKGKGKGKANGWDDEDDDEEDESDDEWGGGEPGIIKPDITFFGQALDSEFDECLFKDREDVDLLVIIGTSLKVAPVSEVLTHIPHSVPQIFINLTPVHHVKPDICLLGDADSIVTYLSSKLGWSIPPPTALPDPPSVDPASSPVAKDAAEEKEVAAATSPVAQYDGVKMERATKVAVPPEEAEWYTVPDNPHVHILRNKNRPPTPPPAPPSAAPSSDSIKVETQPEEGSDGPPTLPAPLGMGEAEGGYVSDADESEDGDERPRKRMKAVEVPEGSS